MSVARYPKGFRILDVHRKKSQGKLWHMQQLIQRVDYFARVLLTQKDPPSMESLSKLCRLLKSTVKMPKYELVDLENETDDEEFPMAQRDHLWKPKKKKKGTSVAIMKHMIMNPFPSLALRGYYGRILLSYSMAEELIWRMLKEQHWEKTQRYFKLSQRKRSKLVSKIFRWIRLRYSGISKALIESQIHLINFMVIGPKLDFHQVYWDRFTRLQWFFVNIEKELMTRVDYDRIIRKPLTFIHSRMMHRVDDGTYSILDGWLTEAKCYFPQWPDYNRSLHCAKRVYRIGYQHVQLTSTKYEYIRFGMKYRFRFCLLKQDDLQWEEENDDSSSTETQTRRVFEELFQLASSSDPTQIILDRLLGKIVISTSMCHELCWFYLPKSSIHLLCNDTDELTRAMFTHFSQYYVGMTLADVEDGLQFLLHFIDIGRSRGLTISQILSDERRRQVFGDRARPYRLLKKYTAGQTELCHFLLGNGNPSLDRVNASISEILCNHPWSINNSIQSLPTIFLEWREYLLTRDWQAMVDSMTRRRKLLSALEQYALLYSVNIWRLVMEVIRCTCDGPAEKLVDGIEEAIRWTPCLNRYLEKAPRRLELAMWNAVTKGREWKAHEYLTTSPECINIPSYRSQPFETMKLILEGMLVFYQLINSNADFNDETHASTIARVLRLLRTNVWDIKNATGVLHCIVITLQRQNRQAEAARDLEQYLSLYPDDLDVYELAVKQLEPEYAAAFGAKLVSLAGWHPLVIDWCQYETSRLRENDDAAGIAVKLMDFLEYGKNKDNADGWALLAVVLSMIRDDQNKETMREAWNERKSWWRKYHLRKGDSENEKLDDLKRNVLQTLDDLGNSSDDEESSDVFEIRTAPPVRHVYDAKAGNSNFMKKQSAIAHYRKENNYNYTVNVQQRAAHNSKTYKLLYNWINAPSAP